jgi:glycosyltransferase involved in cell wall biosynthesis
MSISGANRTLFEIANGLIKRGHDIRFVSLQTQTWFPLLAPTEICNTLSEISRALKGDVIVATSYDTAYIVDSFHGNNGKPVYYCQHYEPLFFFSPKEKEMAGRSYELSIKLVCNSPWLAKQIMEKHGKAAFLLTPGVDLDFFKLMPEKRAVSNVTWHSSELKTETQKDTGCDANDDTTIRLMAFASQAYFKGFYDTLLPAITWAAKRIPVELHLCGEAVLPNHQEFKIISHGIVPDVTLRDLYNSCNLFVNASSAESSPLAPLEAMACGCPVLCTQFGSEHYGDSITRIIPRAPRLLGSTIVNLYNNPNQLEQMTLKGLEAVQNFSWKNTIDTAELFFETLAKTSI